MRLSKIWFVAAFAVVYGCGGGGGGGAPATLVSLTVTPASPSVALGIPEQFNALGTYSDSSVRNVTGSVVWSSSITTVATISNAAGFNGLAVSKGTGTTTISAALGNVSNTAVFTVTPKALVSIAVTPEPSTMPTGTTQQYTAAGTYSDDTNTTVDITASVKWTSSDPNVAVISNATVTSVAAGTAMIIARSGNAPGSAYLTVTGTPVAPANNVLPITVNGSLCNPANSVGYENKPCVRITICTPDSTTACQTIDDILLDTGSFGLRIFKNQAINVPLLNVSLTQVISGAGLLAECMQFGDGSSEWGPVELADVILGNEKASKVPIQVIDSTFATRPAGCLNADAGPTSPSAGFNGILGVGVFVQDCGSACSNSPSNGMYYSCNGKICTGATVSLANQVQNPVASLPSSYNNGVIVELPTVPPNGESSVSGMLVLGIGTQANNSVLSGVTPYGTDGFGDIVATLNGISYSSFIDSGSNALFFTSPSAGLLPSCSAPNSGWFCPSSITTLSATNTGAMGSPSGTVFFQIGNFDHLTSSTNMVFSDIGAAVPGLFDWGLPFYYGRSVYVGIDGTTSSLGKGPYFAY